VAFIAGHADRRSVDGLRWGVEPICRVLSEHGVPIAPSTYYDADRTARRVSAADLREERLMLAIAKEHHDNYSVYGARKVWLTLNRQGVPVARCTVVRLMGVLGLEGVRRGRKVRTTRPDPAAARPGDLVERDFNPARPDQLWVADFTYCPTWAGTVYVAFVIDAFSRRILGWRAATTMRTELVLDALEMAIWTRARAESTTWPGWFITPTPGLSTPRSGSPNGSPTPAPRRVSGRSATPTTTPWPRPRSACSRPS
jgi:putative transposase